MVYEVLVRDFDANRSYQNLIDRIDYFKNLKINAIELMPIMEFEGNESWGYNTSFHMALDKAYGTSAKLKEFIRFMPPKRNCGNSGRGIEPRIWKKSDGQNVDE